MMGAAKSIAPAEDWPLGEFFLRRYVPERLPRPDQANTREQFEIQIRHLQRYARQLQDLGRFDPAAERLRLAHLSDELVKGCMTDLLLKGRAISTANKVHRHIGPIWKFAFEADLLAAPMRCKPFKPHRRLPQAWSLEEIAILLRAAAKARGWVGGVRADEFLPALLQLLWSTGLRVEAALRTPVECFDAAAGLWRTPADVQKQRAEQLFELQAPAVRALQKLRSRERGLRLVFGDWHDDPTTDCEAPWDLLRQAIIAAGLIDAIPWKDADRTRRDWSKHLFHKIRRSVATHALRTCEGDVDQVRQLMGHSSSLTTRAYLDPRFAPQRNASRLIPRLPGFDDKPPAPALRLHDPDAETG